MISPSKYDRLCDQLITLYDDLDNAIISDITRRILKTGRITESAKWQIKQLQESGMLYDDILAEIASRTDATRNHVRTLFEDAGVQSIRNDNRFCRAAGLEGIVKMSDAALQTLNAGYVKCSGNLQNLTLTTAVTSQQAYINACNQAYMQVTSGAFDYNMAIRNAIKSAAVGGTHVLYPSGHRDRIDVAVRRAVLTGVGQTVRKLSVINAEDMGCDIMEITAHSGARPSHAEWQGKLVSLSGKNAGKNINGCRVLSLGEIGYGSGDGFGGWNCRHDWYPFFEGISERAYSDKRLKELDARNIEYNGRKYTEYEISQIQRRYEREIRAAKREQTAFRTAVQETDDPELKQVMQDSLNYANDVVRDKQAKMRDFIRQTGQFRDYSREQNYGRVAYLKNSGKTLTSVANSGKIEESRKNKHVQPINDVSIRKVKALKGGAYSEEQNKIIQAKHKELLEFARNSNPSGECAFILLSNLKNQVNCVGKTSSLDFSSREAINMLTYNRDLYVMHNHPKNSSFSANDIRFLMEHTSVKTLSIIKHNGRLEQLTKSLTYNEEEARKKLRTVFSKYVTSGENSEIDKAIREFINSKELFIYEKT